MPLLTRISLAADIHWPGQPSTQKLAALSSGNFTIDLLSRFNLSCASFSSLAVSIVSLTVFGPLFETNSVRSVFLSSCHLDANASQPSLYFFVLYDANNVKVESVCVSCLYKLSTLLSLACRVCRAWWSSIGKDWITKRQYSVWTSFHNIFICCIIVFVFVSNV